MDTSTLLMAAAIAAILEVDVFAVGMTLVSQPIITGGIAGLFFGDVPAGLAIGAVVQLIWINTPPVGAYVPPSSAAIAFASTVFALNIGNRAIGTADPAILMFSLVVGVAMGYFIGQTDVWARKMNTRIITFFEGDMKQGNMFFLILTQGGAIAFKAVSGFVFYSLLFIFGLPLAAKIYSSLPMDVVDGLRIAHWALPAMGFAVVFDMFRTASGARYHGIALLVSYVFFYFLRGVDALLFLGALFLAAIFIIYNIVWKKKAEQK